LNAGINKKFVANEMKVIHIRFVENPPVTLKKEFELLGITKLQMLNEKPTLGTMINLNKYM
jgi:hypothetical protein